MASHRNTGRGAAAALALIASSFTSPASAKDAPLSLQPSSKWQLDYAADSCKLARSFGEDDQAITLIMTRYSPSPGFSMTVAGPPLKSLPSRGAAKVRFGDYEEEQKLDYFDGTLGELPAMIVTGTTFLHRLTDAEVAARKGYEDGDPSGDVADIARNLTSADAADYIWVDPPRGKPIQLQTGELGKPFRAFEGCIDELVQHWGVDVEKYKLRTRNPVPRESPGRWITWTDYPRKLLEEGGQGIVYFRLSVNADGNVTGCHIQGATAGEGFQEVACKALAERAKFEPALDANGAPMAGYWISRVRFEMPT